MKPEIKTFSFKVDDMDEKGMVRGYASTFGNVDLGLDIVDKGAFKKSIKESGGKIPILADHNPSEQLGWNLRAEEDDKGLFVEGKLDLNVEKARERYSLAKTALEIGASFGLSIGYMTIKAEPDAKNPRIRRLKELKLFEYSMVTFPMNTEAMLTGAKSLVGVDRAHYMISELAKQGISRDEIKLALGINPAATMSEDPDETIQSIDAIIKNLRGL